MHAKSKNDSYTVLQIHTFPIPTALAVILLDLKMSARPVVSVYGKDGKPTGNSLNLPAVFKAPIRPDVVTQVHTGLNIDNSIEPPIVRTFKTRQEYEKEKDEKAKRVKLKKTRRTL